MPIPKPKYGEDKKEFMSRCMADTEMSKYSRSQRTAICLDSYQGKPKKEQSMEQDFQIEEETKTLALFAEIKAYGDDDDDDKDKKYGMFTGYASVFGNKDLGNDIMLEGAFAKSIARKGPKGIKMLFQHKTDEPIGIYEEVREDRKGLYVKGKIALTTQRGKEVYELMKMGAIDGLSIGYKVEPRGAEFDEKGKRRYLKQVDLMEISTVTFPMNPRAKVSQVKSDSTIREFEGVLRDVGLSRTDSKIGAKALTQAFAQRDVGDDASILDAIQNLTSKIKS